MAAISWNNRIFGALRAPGAPALLLREGEGSWRLPDVQEENLWPNAMDRLQPAFSEQLEAPVRGLRQFHYRSDGTARTMEAVIELELLDPGWTPRDGFRWVDRQALQAVQLEREDLRPALEAYLDELIRGEVPALRPPWMLPGWYDRVCRWIADEILRAGFEVKQVLPVKQWGISSVLKVETTGPDFYFKTTSRFMPLFVNEAAITRALSRLFERSVPAPLAVDTAEDWMLLPALTPIARSTQQADVFCRLYRDFAALQIASIPMTADLLSEGAIDRRIDVLIRQLDPLLADPLVQEKLDEPTALALAERLPAFKDLLHRLGRLGIPMTLVHGDLHPGNAAFRGDDLLYFDWTDACIAHPFFDLMSIDWLDEPLQPAVLEAYLEPWRALFPEELLREAVRLGHALLPLHHAVSYQHIQSNLEPSTRRELWFAHEFLSDALERTRELL